MPPDDGMLASDGSVPTSYLVVPGGLAPVLLAAMDADMIPAGGTGEAAAEDGPQAGSASP